ncbi:hypothetical protein [Novipirellula artificiosorum]|uniref:Uncharacterized protein n=1 Tax=Novipirellula artificiosorum TaxID=2528016 RepID=A0A5C6DXH6_9BACT|nr:hypothetical protein [Novipirellula artificiosorum]TWU39736.1 hypothetical protein Poly41_25920 [Novipirellula artificiosorum]
MTRVLYFDDSSPSGIKRFDALRDLLAPDVMLVCAFDPMASAGFGQLNQWDLLVADVRGLGERQRSLIAEIVNTSPDAVLVLVAETLNAVAANAMLTVGAVDCVCWRDGYRNVAKIIRRNLAKLNIARRAIASMHSRIEEFDMSLELDRASMAAGSLAKYTLRHVARMDVCGLRNQLRTVRAFEEAINMHLHRECGHVHRDRSQMHDDACSERGAQPGPQATRVRIHLSHSGFRFTFRESGGLVDYQDLWFARMFMDEMVFDSPHHQMTMMKLPDDVCRNISHAIASRSADVSEHDLLSEALIAAQAEARRP